MAQDALDKTLIEKALRKTSDLIQDDRIEILIVGGAAGMLTGILPAERTTSDCDVIWADPDAALTRLEMAADEVGRIMGLPRGWLNSHVVLSKHKLPPDWRTRRQPVGDFGKLLVWAISRLDFICMKLAAGRDQDIGDLQVLGIEPHEADFAREYLGRLERGLAEESGVDDEQRKIRYADIEKGLAILEALIVEKRL